MKKLLKNIEKNYLDCIPQSSLYSSKFDLIFDHKLKIDEIKRNEIVKMLENKEKSNSKNAGTKK